MGEGGKTVVRVRCAGCQRAKEVRGDAVDGVIRLVCRDCGQRWGVAESTIKRLYPDARREGDAWVRGPASS